MKKLFYFYIVCFSFGIASCASQQTKHNYVDYSNKSSVLHQIKYTERLLSEGKTTDALLHSKVLAINTSNIEEVIELYSKASQKVQEEFTLSVEKNDWEKALQLFRSLVAVGNRPQDWTEEKIFNKRNIEWKRKEHNTLLSSVMQQNTSLERRKLEANTIDEMIKGTVTVWVDRGTRLEKGYGFADVAIGSGFFIDERGYFITNYHVIQSEVDPKYNGYSKLYIKSPYDPDVKISAKVIGWDPIFDLALVKTEVKPEAIFSLGSSKNLKVGSKIFAIGSPAGLDKTLTSGIVSAKYRRLFSLMDAMQIDAAINHGNSGGPIVDENGFVQAVAFAGLEQNEGLNFAIPVELLRSILPDLYSGGEVKHSWLGGFGKTQKKDKKPFGVEVVYILPNGPLTASGIKEGSVITEFNGVPVKTIEEIQAQLLTISPDTIVNVKVAKKNETEEIEYPVLCKERAKSPGEEIFKSDTDWRATLPLFGFYLEPTGRRNSFRVVDVVPGSFAAESGFATNDYIELNGKKWDDDNEIIYLRIYAKKVKAGYIDSFMVLPARLDNPFFF